MKSRVFRAPLIVAACIFVALITVAVHPFADQGGKSDSTAGSSTDAGLRDVFFEEQSAQSEWDGIVGRIGIFLIGNGRLEQVRLDHEFREGDRFRFEVTSNQDGWLYILHSSPGGEMKQLWPRPGSEGAQQVSNMVRAKQTSLVPPSPGVFRFDIETGEELFYVAIRSEKTPPAFSALAPPENVPEPDPGKPEAFGQDPTTRIDNFYIKDPFGVPERGVVFDPGTKDGDSYVYFSSLPEDTKTTSMIRFKLRHVK